MKYLDENGLLYVIQKVKTWLGGKVDKVDGKGLSTNDYTTAEKNKLSGLKNYELPTASSSQLGGVKVGAGLAINDGVLSATGGGTADAVDWANVQNKPTKVSQFTNDSGYQTSSQVESAITGKGYQTSTQVESAITSKGYQTASQVNSAISEAISGVTQFNYEKVSSLPSTGVKGTIYLVPSTKTDTANVYDEYIWVETDRKFEFIGTTAVDLSGYVQTKDLTAITNAEIDTIVAS
jgi:hypothetical protein